MFGDAMTPATRSALDATNAVEALKLLEDGSGTEENTIGMICLHTVLVKCVFWRETDAVVFLTECSVFCAGIFEKIRSTVRN